MDTLHLILETKGKAVFRTSPDAPVLTAVDEMCRHHVGALLVTDGDAAVGIISERDLLKRVLLARRDPATTLVRDVMTVDVVCIELDSTPEEAMRVMTERRCRHLPVVVDGKICALVSIGDLVRWASKNSEFEIRMLHEYVEGKYPG
jgi:CBS domain-containing protein